MAEFLHVVASEWLRVTTRGRELSPLREENQGLRMLGGVRGGTEQEEQYEQDEQAGAEHHRQTFSRWVAWCQ